MNASDYLPASFSSISLQLPPSTTTTTTPAMRCAALPCSVPSAPLSASASHPCPWGFPSLAGFSGTPVLSSANSRSIAARFSRYWRSQSRAYHVSNLRGSWAHSLRSLLMESRRAVCGFLGVGVGGFRGEWVIEMVLVVRMAVADGWV